MIYENKTHVKDAILVLFKMPMCQIPWKHRHHASLRGKRVSNMMPKSVLQKIKTQQNFFFIETLYLFSKFL